MSHASRWDFSDPRAAESRLREALARASGDEALVLRTQYARSLGLQGRFEAAHRELDAVEPSLEGASPEARIFHALERGRVLNSSGERQHSAPRFEEALRIAEAEGADDLAADAAHMLAIVEPPERQAAWAERALGIARRSADPRARRWVAPVENNLAWTLHGLGRPEAALEHFRAALAEREAAGAPGPLRIARWSVARCLRTLGRCDEALGIQRSLEAEHAAQGSEDGYVFEEIAELLLALGREDESRSWFARAHAALSADERLRRSEPERLQRLLDRSAANL